MRTKMLQKSDIHYTFLFLFAYIWSLAVSHLPSVRFTNWNIFCFSICVPCVFRFPGVLPWHFLFGDIFYLSFCLSFVQIYTSARLRFLQLWVYQSLLGYDNIYFGRQVPLFWRNLLPPCFILLKGLINAQFVVQFLLLNPKWYLQKQTYGETWVISSWAWYLIWKVLVSSVRSLQCRALMMYVTHLYCCVHLYCDRLQSVFSWTSQFWIVADWWKDIFHRIHWVRLEPRMSFEGDV